jgi:alginate O-acetyltransferase complex protein AlgI
MLFNSIEFAIFLPIVFALYWLLQNQQLRIQNLLIVAASFLFYGWWDWRFLFLLVFTSLVDFIVALYIQNTSNTKKRKLLLGLSIGANLSVLGFFKYYNFFIDNFVDAFTLLGLKLNVYTLKIILPVGISFYTFQALSYTIDVYRKKLNATRDIVAYFAFISFFPQLVAGPIERATNLLPQFFKKRVFDYEKAVDGMRQMLWGLFKKIVVADSCAVYVNDVFLNYQTYSASQLSIGAIFFSFQIYCDFSGYSDIAIGTARLFGFNLMRNFAFPYFSRDIAEFWRRWHISLTTWFRDYVYIPLGGSRGSKAKIIRNTFIIFLVSGFWHGANWTFMAWGFLHALYFIPLLLTGRNRTNLNIISEDKTWPSLKDITSILITFMLVTVAWIFFRAATINIAITFIGNIFSDFIKHPGQLWLFSKQLMLNKTFYLVLIFLVAEWLQKNKQHALSFEDNAKNFIPRRIIYYTITILIIAAAYFTEKPVEFIYFQF